MHRLQRVISLVGSQQLPVTSAKTPREPGVDHNISIARTVNVEPDVKPKQQTATEKVPNRQFRGMLTQNAAAVCLIKK